MIIQEIKYLQYITGREYKYYYSYTEDELLKIFNNDYLDTYSKKNHYYVIAHTLTAISIIFCSLFK